MLHVDTPLVKTFGNSVIFGDNLGMLPVLLQPLLFYPDWYFMAWPFQLILAFVVPDGHPYLHDLGFGVWAWGSFYFLLGMVFRLGNLSSTINEMLAPKFLSEAMNFVASMQAKGVLGEVFVLPMVLLITAYRLTYNIFSTLLYFHVAIAIMVGSLLSFGGAIGPQLTKIVNVICLLVMIVPALITMVCSTIFMFSVLV